MRALTLIHRWLGVAFALFFAMWFASGIVMHFVPFPALTEAERIDGLAPLSGTAIQNGPDAAIRASGLAEADRVRLFVRSDGAIYVIRSGASVVALHAENLSPAGVRTGELAVAIAADHARRRGLDVSHASLEALADYDQWSVPNDLDPHRPLYRIALGDAAGTELYVSSQTGEVVRDTTRRERAWNYAGSVVHWIYPTVLRRNWPLWDATVWTLSLIALLTAIAGVALGVLRMRWRSLSTPYRAWHAWHHALGIGCALFVLTWIASGWLSMDHGRIFSTGKPDAHEARAFTGELLVTMLGATALSGAETAARELGWFDFGGRAYRRERIDLERQHLRTFPRSALRDEPWLTDDEVTAAARRLAGCGSVAVVGGDDAYAMKSATPGAPVYRVQCGETWLHVDGASGALLERLDPSRRAYRWLYSALHTLDFPALMQRPTLRTAIVVVLCAVGFVFSMTGVVIGWRRLTKPNPNPPPP
ncbi:MAG TPA: PepSY domain-containing protein [Burkholderiales bacterium]|nr:PepSY domain-containing protein [Burkholderiales bacterium]